VFAEDISDFEIEGMSVGDNLLDYFSDDFISLNIQHPCYIISNPTPNSVECDKGQFYHNFEELEFIVVGFIKLPSFNTYDFLTFYIDRNFIIYGINGIISYDTEGRFDDRVENCSLKMGGFISNISEKFNYTKKLKKNKKIVS